jgi:hypothetical protein
MVVLLLRQVAGSRISSVVHGSVRGCFFGVWRFDTLSQLQIREREKGTGQNRAEQEQGGIE